MASTICAPSSTPSGASGQGRGRKARPRHSTGRWSLLFPGETADRAKALEAVCRVLLERYGVVFRELTLREEFPVKWRELLITFRRLEDRGEVRGGRFVDGFVGEQFALPSALESLRAARHVDASRAGEILTLSAADPLNLVGIIVPGERVPAISGKTITLRDGVPDAESPTILAAVEVCCGLQALEITQIRKTALSLGRGCPAAGAFTSRSGTGEGSLGPPAVI